jgi:hypothetical protein
METFATAAGGKHWQTDMFLSATSAFDAVGPPIEHVGPVSSLAFSPDGRFALGGIGVFLPLGNRD